MDARLRAEAILPGIANFRGYQRSWIRGDVAAGLSVAAYLIPQALAYATLAGLSPVTGLWVALPPLLVYAATLAILVGAICLAAGLLKLGFLASLLSEPVLVGYLAGIAVLMGASQLGRLAGVTTGGGGENAIDQLRGFLGEMAQVNWTTVVFSCGVLALIFAVDRWVPLLPAPLVGVVLATAIVEVFALTRKGIDVIGRLSAEEHALGWPVGSVADVRALFLPALGIAMVAFSDNVLTARAFATRSGDDIDANVELRALGVCNLTVGFAHGFPVSSSGSRTALGDAAGSRTQLYSLTALAVTAIVLAFGRGAIGMIPAAVLGALVPRQAPVHFAESVPTW